MLSLIAAALLQTAAAAAPPPDAPPIVVTGRRLKDYAAALDACLAAHCPPRQDVVASVRYAEALFRSGDYHGAREVLAKATHRNAAAGPQEPLAVSQLYLAQANVAAHFGEQRDVASATIASARVADSYLPAGDPDRLWADLRLADWRLSSQRLERDSDPRIADGAYIRIAAEARAAGHPEIAAAADVHRAWALHRRRDEAGATAVLAQLTTAPGEAVRPYRLAARVLTARIARDRGDRTGLDAAIRAIGAESGGHVPILVYSPPYPTPTDPNRIDPYELLAATQNRPGDLNGLQWADIGFAIRADGTVADAEVLRGSRTTDWAKPLLTMIAGRRYTAGAADAPDAYRVERFTLTADFALVPGSLIRRRVSAPRYEALDITTDPARPAA